MPDKTILDQNSKSQVNQDTPRIAAAASADATVMFSDSGSSVLPALGIAPRVMLRDEAGGLAEPVVQATSSELPATHRESRYQLFGEIARGGMGAILKGRDNDLGRDLAIKVLLESHRDKPEVLQRFIEEAQISGQLQHPGIVPIYELGQFADQRPFFSMKLVKGQTLAALLAERKTPSDDRTRFLGIYLQICQTLAYAHSRGVIHRDLKPANVMVGAFGEVQVMDWGLAKVLGAGGVADEKKAIQKQQDVSVIRTVQRGSSGSAPIVGSHTLAGSVMGTPAYMAPEQALGEVDRLDERADVFGLGAILCEILTGKPPYLGQDGTEVFRRATRGKLDDCYARLDACEADRELVDLAKECLSVEPDQRPRNAGAVAEKTSGYLASVESRLRATEVERASEAARAEEALHTVAEAEAKARAERRARRLQLGLAVVFVCVTTFGGLAAAWTAMYQSQLKLDAQLAEKKAVAAREAESKQLKRTQTERERAEAERGRAEQAKSEALAAKEEIQRQSAETAKQREFAERGLYASQIALANHYLESADTVNSRRILAKLVPKTGEKDRRGWEWNYLMHWSDSATRLMDDHTNTYAVAFSPDGRLLATSGGGNPYYANPGAAIVPGEVVLRDLATGRILHEMVEHSNIVTALAFSPDGKTLASVGHDRQIILTDVETGHPKGKIKETHKKNGVRSVEFSSNGKHLCVQWKAPLEMNIHPCTTTIYSVEEARSLHTVDSYGATYSHDGGLLYWLNAAGLIQGIDLATLKESEAFSPIQAPALSALLTPSHNGRFLAVALGQQVLIWNVSTKQVVQQLFAEELSECLAFSPDDSLIAATGSSGVVRVFGLANGNRTGTLLGNTSRTTGMTFSPDGQWLVTSEFAGSVRFFRGNQTSRGNSFDTMQDQIAAMALNGKGTKVYTASWHGKPGFASWNANTGSVLKFYPDKSTQSQAWPRSDFGFTADGRRLAAPMAADASSIMIWDTTTGEELIPPIKHSGSLSAVALRPDGTRLVTAWTRTSFLGTTSGVFQIWDAKTGAPLGKAYNSEHIADALKFSRDGKLLATGGTPGIAGRGLSIWDIEKGTAQFHLESSSSRISGIDFSPDGSQLAEVDYGASRLQIWDTVQGKKIATTPTPKATCGVAYSPDGKRLAVMGYDADVHLFHAETLEELLILKTLGPPSGSLGFSPIVVFSADGSRIAANTPHGIVGVWCAEASLSTQHQDDPEEDEATQLVAAMQANWSLLKATSAKSRQNVELTLGQDGTILAKSQPDTNDSYTIKGSSTLRKITAIRLEALPHPGLPETGPGLAGGNFHLTEVRAWVQKPGQNLLPLKFLTAEASHTRMLTEGGEPKDGPLATIDGNQGTHWDIWPFRGQRQWLVLVLQEPLDLAEGDELVVELDFLDPRFRAARLGHFRLSVNSVDVFPGQALLGDVVAKRAIAGTANLAAAYLGSGNAAHALKLLSAPTHPGDTDSEGIRLLLLAKAQQQLGQKEAARQTSGQLLELLRGKSLPRDLQPLAIATLSETSDLKPSQARALFDQDAVNRELARLTKEIEAEPKSPAKYQARGNFLNRLGRWKESAADYSQLVELDPTNRFPRAFAACSLLLADDKEGYRKHCRATVEQFRESNEAEVADTVCKISLLDSGAIELSELPLQKLRDATADPKWEKYRSWFVACCALASYREGKHEDAINWTKKMPSLDWQPGTLALVVRAMAEEKLGEHEQAVKSLDQVEAQIPAELRTLGTAEYSGPLLAPQEAVAHDWLMP